MKLDQLRLILPLCLFAAAHAPAAIRYVDVNGSNPAPPYTDWSTAATNIQDAVDAAAPGDQILVTNGVYQTGGKAVFGTTNRVAVDKPVAVQSVNGPQVTIINGGGAVRCVYLANGTLLTGFTITNGSAGPFFAGGGVAFGDFNSDAVVSNCVIVGCRAPYGGGVGPGGPFYGYVPLGGTLNNCIVRSNSAGHGNFNIPGVGGVVYGTTLNNCTLVGNSAQGPGGGGGASSSRLQNCILTGNSASASGGGTVYRTLINCTLTGNNANLAGGASQSRLTNCIAYYNSDPNYSDCSVTYSCTTPLPAFGLGNITNAPLFVDLAGGNLRLQSNSPCIDAGNNDYVTSPVDLEGRERIVGGTVDMGAYEWVAVPTHYVSLNSPNPTPPYLSWSTAATNIQHAVNAASFGDAVLVTNGIYQSGGRFVSYNTIHGPIFGSNRLWVSKALRVESVNGPTVTSIVGYQIPGTTNGLGAIRCAYLVNGAVLSGFTLTNGATESPQGGGVYCESTDAVVSNCVITGNAARLGGGSYGGTLKNCTLIGNTAHDPFSSALGGGAYGGRLINCVLMNNRAQRGGGVASGNEYQNDECRLTNCTLEGNTADHGGGAAYDVFLQNCTVRGNSAYRGGGIYGDPSLSVYPVAVNCLLIGNRARGGLGGGAYGGWLSRCTVVGNSLSGLGGGAGVINTYLDNSIVYHNTNLFGATANHAGSAALYYCCTTPMPGTGVGNIIPTAPLFVDPINGNFRLQSNSPCINAGKNSFAPANDLDGNPRIAGGTMDIGAYEFQSPSSVLSYAWAQQFGLSTDGSADYSDSDSDRLNNWQEWIAGTVPTDASSALRLFYPSNNVSGVTVTWQSVTNRTYFLERANNLAVAPPFSLLTSNIIGQPGTTSFTDTNALGTGPFFYRVGVQP